MEQHPVPQDIKSFQFKLIGDMTLRQFAFLAGGLVVAYIAFILPLHPLVKWSVILSSSLFGIGCAFFPINEQSLDRWIVAFFKAIFNPTQRVWKKSIEPPAYMSFTSTQTKPSSLILPVTEDREKLKEYLASLPKKTEEALDEEEKKFLSKIQPFLSPGENKVLPKTIEDKTQKPSLAAGEIPIVQPVLKVRDITTASPKHIPSLSGARVRKLGKPKNGQLLKAIPVEIPVTPLPKPSLPPKVIFSQTEEITKMARGEVAKAKRLEEYQEEIEKLKAEKEHLLKDALLKQEETRKAREAAAKMTRKPPSETPPKEKPAPSKPSEVPTPTVSRIRKLVLPRITDCPNIINGIVADREGRLLESVVIVIKDQDLTPVRALKTNSLGQFATATSLPNGVYSVEAEKEGYQFDIIYQEAKGGVLPPLEIRAR